MAVPVILGSTAQEPPPDTNFLQDGVTARIGFRYVYVFGNYALAEMFKGGRCPMLTPYTSGLGF